MGHTVVVDTGAGEVIWKKCSHFGSADKEASYLAKKQKFKKVFVLDDDGTITDYKKLVIEERNPFDSVRRKLKLK